MSETTASGSLPKVSFGDVEITRLIVGGNPFVANSHFTEKMNRDMAEYYTAGEIVRTLHRCQAAGINTVQARGDYHRILHYLELFRREGGQLNFIAQTASEMSDIHTNIKVIAAFGAAGIYFHGTRTDQLWREGKIDSARDYLKTMRDCGIRVGLATHMPEVFDYVESKGWDIDFYMVPFYNIARNPRESAVVTGRFEVEEFDEADPPVFCRFIRSTRKQCLAYKVLGAGRACGSQEAVRERLRWTYASIKPQDCVVLGMFPKYIDQPNLNAGYAIEAIRAAGQS